MSRLDWICEPCGPLSGGLSVPGDKSVSHRSLMLAALADGVSRIEGFLEGEDTHATAAILQQLGVRIEEPGHGVRVVHGVGLHGLRPSAAMLDCGNAGTGMRLLAGLLAGQAFDSVLGGDASLSKRPMRRVTEPLAQMGARIDSEPGGVPPLRIHGGQALRGIDYTPPMASAQVKSAVLLAGLYASGETVVRELHPTRDYTERMLAAFGWPVVFEPGLVRLQGRAALKATDVHVPADFSSAAFFIVAASVVPGSALRLRQVGLNPRRTGLLEALRRMGAHIRIDNRREFGGEEIGDILVRHAELKGIDVPPELAPDMIDEFPALFIAAAAATGTTRVRGAAELRVKESDRIAMMARGLTTLGIAVTEHPDGIDIVGGRIGAGEIEVHGDHRIAMSFAVAAGLARGAVTIRDCATVATSFPGFERLATACGMHIHPLETALVD
ncbi:MAG TPA: 3-phosphoshikimate 1-carboxyvinyltransferase [Rhodanobacteraceae bacterium]|nr:3-phosphoshikimate 1-carboxyvinyltransferase [Rhodanobacteraceae bacterium]